MRWIQRHRRIVVGVVVAVMMAAFCLWIFKPWNGSSGVVTRVGGTVHGPSGVSVRVPAGGVAVAASVAFHSPRRSLPAAPVDVALSVIGQAVDIMPSRPLHKAEVAFAIPSAAAPADRLPFAGIQVFNPLVGWITLETRVEGRTLVAVAPHFSLYRAVLPQPGEYTVLAAGKDVRLTVTPETSAPGLFWDTAGALAKQLVYDGAGAFDEGKFKCQPPHQEYVVTVNPPTDANRTAACVVTAENGGASLVIKNGWPLPAVYTTDAAGDVKPDVVPGVLEPLQLVRNVLVRLYGYAAFANGLDVASFTISPDGPESFTVSGRVSWAATAVEIVMALLTVAFPVSLLARQVNSVVAAMNCVAVAAQNIAAMPAGEIPGKLAELLKKCLWAVFVEKLGIFELVRALGNELKLIPMLKNIVDIAVQFGMTGQGVTDSSVTVRRSNAEWFQGEWTYDCAGASHQLTVTPDKKAVLRLTQFNAANRSITQTVTATVLMMAGKPVLVVDDGAGPLYAYRPGTQFTAERRFTASGDEWVMLTDPSAREYPLFRTPQRDGGSVRSYC